jgi:transposase-like protein
MKRGARDWQEVTQFFVFDPAIRKIIHATNATPCINRVIRIKHDKAGLSGH